MRGRDGQRDDAGGNETPLDSRFSRRRLLQGAAAAGLTVGAGGLLAACGGEDEETVSPEPPADTGAPSAATTAASGDEPKTGGRLRVGHVGGGEAETFNPGLAASFIDASRCYNTYDNLAYVTPDFEVVNHLAEEFVPNEDGTVWDIRLREGVTFHNGKDLTADDLIYTIRTAAGPKHAASSLLANFDLKGMKKLDDLTLRVPLKSANGRLQDIFTQQTTVVIQDGHKDFTKPIGTGPFMLESFEPGVRSLSRKNPNYWLEGKPYVDELEDISIADDSARLNALLSGELDAMEQLPYALAKQQQDAKEITVLDAPSPNILPILMAVDLEPFEDVRVRQAFRLIADRPALIEGALLGYGTVGNDLFGKGLALFNEELPQREQDLEQAKSLLKAAGMDGLQVTLHSSKIYPGMLESATIFAEQAKGAGVTITVKEEPANSYFDQSQLYTKINFGQSFWNAASLAQWYGQSVVSSAVWNETHWKRPAFDELYNEAIAEVDEARAQELWNELQQTLYDEGGYLIWCYVNLVDAVANNVRGAPASGFFNLSAFNYKDFWLA